MRGTAGVALRGLAGRLTPPELARIRVEGRPPRALGRVGASRPAMPRRWTLPMTALRETPPNCRAT
jgi:hypothetical protein